MASAARALWTAALGLLLILAGLAFGPTPLLVPGVGLVLVGVGSAGWVGLAASGRLERRIGAASVVEDEPCALRMVARTRVGPPPGSELVEPLLPGGPRAVDWRARTQHLSDEVRFPRRGLVRAAPARLVVRDPLGLASRAIRSEASEVLVLPRIEPVRAAAGTQRRAGVLSAMPAAEGAQGEIDSLREAPPEASATRIHWPAVARTGTLIERTLAAHSDRLPLVVLDASSPASSEALDSAVRAAASLCVWLARRRGCELLLPGDRRPSAVEPGLAAWPPLHARLALLAEGGRPAASGRLGRAGTVFWVTATAAGPPRALLRAGAAERYLVTPGLAPPGAAFAVAGCHGRRLDRAVRTAA